MTVLVCLWIAIVVMPFVMLLSLILWFIAWMNQRGLERSARTHRLPGRVRKRVRLARWLWWGSFAEFCLLMVVSWVWPGALNWW